MTGRRRFLGSSLWVLAGLPLALGACGRRGSLKPPKGEEGAYRYPGSYPAPDSVRPPRAPGAAAEEPAPAAPEAEDPPLSPLPLSPRRSKPYGS